MGPFILVQISDKGGETNAWEWLDQDSETIDFSNFQCFFDGNNVASPRPADEWEAKPNAQSWSAEMMKMNIGFTKFSFKYVKDDKKASNPPVTQPEQPEETVENESETTENESEAVEENAEVVSENKESEE